MPEEEEPSLEEMLRGLGEIDEEFKQRIELSSHLTQLGYNLDKKEHTKKMRYYRAALELNSDNIAARNNLAWNLYRTKKYEGAMEHYARIVEVKPDHSLAPRNLRRTTDAYIKVIETWDSADKQIQAYEKIVRFDPANETAHNKLKTLKSE